MRNKAMIVDDDFTICEIGKEMFEIFDVEAEYAQTMEEAVTYFTANHSEIGLIIFDLNLEECTGIEVFEALKQIDPEFVGIMASGQFIDEDAPKYTAIGFKEIIMKPYNLNKLKEIITKYLGA